MNNPEAEYAPYGVRIYDRTRRESYKLIIHAQHAEGARSIARDTHPAHLYRIQSAVRMTVVHDGLVYDGRRLIPDTEHAA